MVRKSFVQEQQQRCKERLLIKTDVNECARHMQKEWMASQAMVVTAAVN